MGKDLPYFNEGSMLLDPPPYPCSIAPSKSASVSKRSIYSFRSVILIIPLQGNKGHIELSLIQLQNLKKKKIMLPKAVLNLAMFEA